MNTEQAEDYIRSDTEFVLNYEYSREILQHGLTWSDSPIFDTLAADRFASDRGTKVENPAERRNHEFDRLGNYEEYNLGDYR